MLSSKSLLFLIFITLSAVGASPLRRDTGKAALSIATKINAYGTLTISEIDRARVQVLKQTAQAGKPSTTFSVANSGVIYTAEVGVGEPATNYTLLIDTGSSNTFVGANKSYVPTSTSKNTGNSVAVGYGSGNFSGEEWLDTVTLAPGLVIDQQSIGVANKSSGFNDCDGILGLGPIDLTYGTVSNTTTVPTVTDNLFSQGKISEEVLGVYFVPSSEPSSTGMLTFGGYDSSVTTGPVNYVPLTNTTPAAYYWGFDCHSIKYGSTTLLSSTVGIADTGTTQILIATDAFQKYQNLTGGVMDSVTGLLAITPAQYNKLQSLTYKIGSKTYELTPNGQIWPRSLNTAIGGNSSFVYLMIADIGTPSGSGLDFLNGYTFLERFYSVFDTTNQRIGFATTRYTKSTTN